MYIAIAAILILVVVAAFLMSRKSGESSTLEDVERPALDSAQPTAREEVKASEPTAEPAPVEQTESSSADSSIEAPPAESGDAPSKASEETATVEKPTVEEPAVEEAGSEAAEVEATPAEAKPAAARRITGDPSADDLAALRKGLGRTRGGFIKRLAGLFKKGEPVDESILDEMEEVLVTADIGVKTVDSILETLREALKAGNIKSGEEAWAVVKNHAEGVLSRHGAGPVLFDKTPTVILVVGVNGVGKTTTIGKLASRLKDEGKSVLLAAGDTFRAAAVLQLEQWGRRTQCEVVKGKDRADPGSVIFDAVKQGVEGGYDVVLADTAGRLHTKSPLMDELAKVGRTTEKALGRPADEVLLVLDATTGQNAMQQAEMFKTALPLSGLVLTKLDGSAKGGVILGVVDRHELPVRYVGVGERVEDLREFSPKGFVDVLFERPTEESA